MTEQLLRLSALKVLSDKFKKLYDEARAEESAGITRGSTIMVYSPVDGEKLGAVSMSDPKTTARIADQNAFAAWAARLYPDDVEFEFEIIGSHQEVVAVLYEHAGHLLKRTSRVSPKLVKQVTACSAEVKEPAGPNGELDVPGVVVETAESRLSCLPASGALPTVMALVRERLPLELLAADTSDGAA